MKIVDITSTTITRPADTTAYASGDLVANSTTAGSVTPFVFRIPYGQGLMIHRVGLTRSDTDVANASFRVHFYKDSPTVTNGDNGAWLSIIAGHQGSVDVVGTSPAFSAGARAFGVYVNNSVYAPLWVLADVDRYLYALLEARAAYTPASAETFTLNVVGEAYI